MTRCLGLVGLSLTLWTLGCESESNPVEASTDIPSQGNLTPLSDPPPGCTPGTSKCTCATTNPSCPTGHTCLANICEPIAQGAEGGPCWGNNTCNQDPTTGQGLAWIAGLCKRASCPQCELGCGRYPGTIRDIGLHDGVASGAPRCTLSDCTPVDANSGLHTRSQLFRGPERHAAGMRRHPLQSPDLSRRHSGLHLQTQLRLPAEPRVRPEHLQMRQPDLHARNRRLRLVRERRRAHIWGARPNRGCSSLPRTPVRVQATSLTRTTGTSPIRTTPQRHRTPPAR